MKNPFQRHDEGGGSFLPADYVQRRSELRANIICLTLFGIVMFAIVAAFFVTNRQWMQVRKERQAITVQYTQQAARIEQLKNLEDQKAEMMAKAEVTTALIEKVPRSILMAELVTRMPQQLALLELNLSSRRVREAPARQAPAAQSGSGQVKNLGGRSQTPRRAGTGSTTPAPERITAPRFEYTLRLIGVAHANNHIADYLAALKACSLLDQVELKYIKPATIDRAEFRQFEIEAVLRRDADARGIEASPEIRRAMDAIRQSNAPEPEQKSSSPVSTVPEGAK